ncbi:YaaC family protein [Bacillus multifaciens]|uniref:YaaC family protein n=1 Tax=Bacillus multifaciens TaxID=3068506 RepID=UPI0027404366|nr:YaaC family protein [Bacillus sp. WLY-B-L8]MDP7980117.1 YaaC family protein [Bacillus sp. WLY-B-L8]HDX9591103.1 YaaC family protein [Bacillus pseudomycoides]
MQQSTIIWQKLSFFLSSTHTQHYLTHCYKKLSNTNTEKKSFENCYPFIYYLEHGKNYYQSCNTAPFSIKPVLLFYGMSQLLKACLLTVDPNYPESTSVLAHGVTTRKRKKQGYQFIDDEVKIQKHGLFTHVAEQMFHVKHLEGEKYTMEGLLQRIAELADLFRYSKRKNNLYQLKEVTENIFTFPTHILDTFHMTEERFIRYIEGINKHLNIRHTNFKENDSHLYFSASMKEWTPLYSAPLTYNHYTNAYYLPANKEMAPVLPELLIHYLLLYNLSMISRYETDWWYDLLGSYASEDYPFIFQFLAVTAEKVPYYIYLYLMSQHNAIS